MGFGNVPDPGIQRRILDKPELAGWEDAGRERRIVGVCVHRMLGHLQGTENFFMDPNDNGWGALTDFGIGGRKEIDLGRPDRDGAIWQWNELTGRRRPWANGWGIGEDPDHVTEGHGRVFWEKWSRPPYNCELNTDLASIELSGCTSELVDGWPANWCGADETEVTDKQFEALSHLIAYICDHYCRISYQDFPFNPAVDPGFYAVYQHYEFAGKNCPFTTARALHGAYVARAKEILEQYQTQDAPQLAETFAPPRGFSAVPGAVGRTGPSREFPDVEAFQPGEAITSDGYARGQLVPEFNDDRWLRTTVPPSLWVHASGVEEEI